MVKINGSSSLYNFSLWTNDDNNIPSLKADIRGDNWKLLTRKRNSDQPLLTISDLARHDRHGCDDTRVGTGSHLISLRWPDNAVTCAWSHSRAQHYLTGTLTCIITLWPVYDPLTEGTTDRLIASMHVITTMYANTTAYSPITGHNTDTKHV